MKTVKIVSEDIRTKKKNAPIEVSEEVAKKILDKNQADRANRHVKTFIKWSLVKA